ncbi:hypothetical protein [Hyphomicrobium sp. MC8b]|uniref:hypothetical protein n=1 Tax=Hyphomicrobium sp. MC8b TaxID=300273 RepID=UPI00391B35C9
MRHGYFLAFFCFVAALAATFSAARADCTLTQNGELRPPGAVVREMVTGHVLYCDDTQWKVLVTGPAEPAAADPSTFSVPTCLRPSHPIGVNDIENTAGWDILAVTLPAGPFIFGVRGQTTTSEPDIYAFTFDGTDLDRPAEFMLPAGGSQTGGTVGSDGTYLYLADEGTRVYALSFNGTSFTSIAAYNAGVTVSGILAQGGYIYLALGTTGVRAMTFNGTAWSVPVAADTYNTPGVANALAGDGTNVFVADGASGVRALNFNGTAWSSLATFSNPTVRIASNADGSRIAALGDWTPSYLLSFNGTSFTNLTPASLSYSGVRAVVSGDYIYISDNDIRVYEYANGVASIVGMYPGGGNGVEGITSDGNYLYAIQGFGAVQAFPFCGTGSTDNTPATPVFPNQTTGSLSAAVSSAIVQITGVSGATAVSISGSGSPQFRICLDPGCNAVLRDWSGSASNIFINQYLQLRVTSAASYGVGTAATVSVGTVNAGWTVTTDEPCTAPADNFISVGTTTTSVPSGCAKATIEAWGAGGGGGFGATAITDRRSGGGGGGSGVARGGTVLAAGGGGGGGSGAAAGTDNGGGGGGYVIANNVAVTSGESLNIYVGAGGQSSCSAGANGAGGAYNGTAGAAVGVAAANVAAPGFGGGGGAVNGNGGNSTYGGGGGNAGSGAGGTSTSGGAGGGTGASNNGAVGVRGTGFGGTVTNGVNGTAGAGGAGATGGGFTAGAGAAGANCANVGGDGRVRVTWLD